MILDETKLASAVLDGEEEETPAAPEETRAEASAIALDGEEENGGAGTPTEEGNATEESLEPAEGGEQAV